MKLYRPWQYLYICSSSRSQNEIVTITLDSDMTGGMKTLHMMFHFHTFYFRSKVLMVSI